MDGVYFQNEAVQRDGSAAAAGPNRPDRFLGAVGAHFPAAALEPR